MNILHIWSKYSPRSVQVHKYLMSVPGVNQICIDHPEMRQRIKKSNKLKIKYLPCILIVNGSQLDQYEGDVALQWLKEFASERERMNAPPPPPQPVHEDHGDRDDPSGSSIKFDIQTQPTTPDNSENHPLDLPVLPKVVQERNSDKPLSFDIVVDEKHAQKVKTLPAGSTPVNKLIPEPPTQGSFNVPAGYTDNASKQYQKYSKEAVSQLAAQMAENSKIE